ncbi:lactonase family protein [Sphingomonas aerolata]
MTPPVFNNITRRTLLSGMATATIAAGLRAAPPSPRDARVLVGTYAREGGKGLYTLSHDRARNRWQVEPPVAGIDDASFAVRAPRTGLWYVLREQAKGSVTGFAPGWKARGTMPSGGADPCHAAFDDASGCLAIANYSSGSVGFYRIDPATGAPGEPTIFRHEGTGPDKSRQEGPHAHWVGFSPDRNWLHSVDLGADTIFAYRFDPGKRSLAAPVPAWRAPPGTGPRHLVWHPRLPRAYVVAELANTVTMLDAQPDGRFTTRTQLSTLPGDHVGSSQAAHIAIDRAGRHLYVSNRGADSIAVFALDRDGVPTLVQHIAAARTLAAHLPPARGSAADAGRERAVGHDRDPDARQGRPSRADWSDTARPRGGVSRADQLTVARLVTPPALPLHGPGIGHDRTSIIVKGAVLAPHPRPRPAVGCPRRRAAAADRGPGRRPDAALHRRRPVRPVDRSGPADQP